MRSLPLPASIVLACGLALGILGDALLRAEGAPGLNLFVWATAVAAAAVMLHRRGDQKLSREALTLLGGGVLFAGALVWRDSETLKLIAVASAVVCFALPAFRAGAAWIRGSSAADYVAAMIAAGVHALVGVAQVLRDVEWDAVRRDPGPQARWKRAAAVARGVAIALPIIFVFGGLFVSADAVFAGIVADAVRVDFETLASHVLLIGFLAWIATGYLGGSLTGTRLPVIAPHRPTLAITEVGTALGLLGLLFLAFVIVQFRYLFGGSALVEVTPGLTYAEYARHGFFQLVTVVALILPLLLGADWLLRRERPRDEQIFRALTATQLVLVLAVLASALKRMQLYQAAFGMTEDRLYATAFLMLLAVVLFWFALTVLRGRRESFAFGALIAALVSAAVLYAVNPDAIIARTNITRAMNDSEVDRKFDVAYATSLSADAVPILLAALPTLPADARCPIARRLLRRWPPDVRPSLRTWSWSDARARSAVRERAEWLRGLAPPAGTEECPARPIS